MRVSEEKTNQLLKRVGEILLIDLLINNRFSKLMLSLNFKKDVFLKIKDWYENFEVDSS